MRIQNLLFTLFVLSLPFSAFCQQQRTITREESLELRLGALRNLEEMTYRFEVAWQEQDCPSLQEIRQELLRMMQVETEACARLKPRNGREESLSAIREQQQQLIRELRDYKLPTAASEFPDGSGEGPLASIAAFRKLTQETLEQSF
ncbi:MAG: hypothetical protein RI973_1586 [Bacteroidota bacterium]